MSDQTDADLRRVAVGSSDLFGTFRKSCWDGDMIGFHFFRNRMRLGYYPRHPWDEWKFWRQFFKVRLRPNLHFRVWRFAISVRYLPNDQGQARPEGPLLAPHSSAFSDEQLTKKDQDQ